VCSDDDDDDGDGDGDDDDDEYNQRAVVSAVLVSWLIVSAVL